MKKTNRNLLFAMACVMAGTLSACGGSTTAATTAAATTAAETATEAADTATEAAEAATTDAAADTSAAESGELQLGTYPDGSHPVLSGEKVNLKVNGEDVVIAMYDNTAADAFLERLPLEELEFYDLSGIEKPARQQDEEFSIGEETPGYDPVTGEMVIYRPWGNFTIFYGDFRHSDELVPLGIVESGLDVVANQSTDFIGNMEIME